MLRICLNLRFFVLVLLFGIFSVAFSFLSKTLGNIFGDAIELTFQPEEYKKEAWQMDAGEKAGEIPALREEGNRLFKGGRVEEAEEKYKTAIGMLEQLMLREKPQDAEWLDLRSRKVPLLLNFAQCKLSKKEYYPVIEHTTEVLESDPGEYY